MKFTWPKLRIKTSKKVTHYLLISLAIFLSLIILSGLTLLGILFYFHQRAMPGVMVMNQPVGGLNRQQILSTIQNELQQDLPVFTLVSTDKVYEISWDEIGYKPFIELSVEDAVTWGKYIEDLGYLKNAFTNEAFIPLRYEINNTMLNDFIQTISEDLALIAQEPQIRIASESGILITNGSVGQKVNEPEFRSQLQRLFMDPTSREMEIPLLVIDKTINNDQIESAQRRAQLLLDKKLILKEENSAFEIEQDELLSLIGFDGRYHERHINEKIAFLAARINRPPQDAVFEFDDQIGRVQEFKADKPGKVINQEQLFTLIQNELGTLEKNATHTAELLIPTTTTPAEISVSNINDLGIKELIGRGESYFKGSIPGRVHNIELATSRLHGALIPPGGIISFNELVGEISRATGYQSAYVIQGGRTVLGDGGGVCQVSSTLFRAALNTGLPIEERKAHSYRVGYYEQLSHPGLDATIYSPSVDLKIRNDTPGHILVQSTLDKENYHLVFEFYGTSDGRVAIVDNFTLTGVSAPPEDLYIDDPSLPAGTIKQVEHKAWGAKASFDWKVTRGDEVLQEKTFYSNFRPWQAVFLRGIGPQPV